MVRTKMQDIDKAGHGGCCRALSRLMASDAMRVGHASAGPRTTENSDVAEEVWGLRPLGGFFSCGNAPPGALGAACCIMLPNMGARHSFGETITTALLYWFPSYSDSRASMLPAYTMYRKATRVGDYEVRSYKMLLIGRRRTL